MATDGAGRRGQRGLGVAGVPHLESVQLGAGGGEALLGHPRAGACAGPCERSRETRILLAAFAALALAAIGIAGRDLATPGLYYDEVIQAEPAVQFLAEGGRPLELPGMRSLRLLGRWWPLMTQSYMGALKSQALVPGFALFGADACTLRATTLAWGLLGLLLAMLLARELLGLGAALAAGALLALDPSLLFAARHDWGSFALGFACRSGGLLLLARGAARGSPPLAGAAGLLFGLGFYNKIDFAVFLVAAALALLAVAARPTLAVLRSRPALAAALALGFALGAAPMLASLPAALGSTGDFLRAEALRPEGYAERLAALLASLDGSYFHRLLLAGGSFEVLFAVEGAAGGPFPLAFAAASALLLAALLRDARLGGADRAQAFVLATALLLPLGILLTPRAARIHHALLAAPFPQLVVGLVLARAGRRAGARGGAARLAAAAVLALLLATHLAGDLRTLSALRASGGKGRWSSALQEFGRELAGRPGAVAVSLDWGLHLPLRFAERGLALEEPIWRLRAWRGSQRLWVHEGSPAHVYLLPEPRLAVFGFGEDFLEALRGLPPGSLEIREHVDREGDPAFRSVRFARPHRVTYLRDRFEVRLR